MPYKLRVFECAGCGQPVERNRPEGAEVRCILCAVGRSVENALQQRSKSGEFYQRWARGMARAAREAEQLAAIGAEIDSIG